MKVQTEQPSAPYLPMLLMLIATGVAIWMANSPWQDHYLAFIHQDIKVGHWHFHLTKSLLVWVNEGLMTLFFFSIGLELQHEWHKGDLQTTQSRIRPALLALGGMIIPALIYALVIIRQEHFSLLHGWAIPTATDIAFSLGIIRCFGSSLPRSYAVLLASIAIFDDLGAVMILACFYGHGLNFLYVMLAMIAIGLMWCARARFWLYIGLCILLWLAILKSGLHASLSGFLMGLLLPNQSMDQKHIHRFHQFITFGLVPLFAFVNTGIVFPANWQWISSQWSLFIAIFSGLVVGKPLGIFWSEKCCQFFGVKSTQKKMPVRHVLGIGCLCGIGFTMSLFIGTLAFNQQDAMAGVLRISILSGSFASAMIGVALLCKQVRVFLR
jgi:NhaA family Na+:H+ antiporter